MRQEKEGRKERSLYEVSYHVGQQKPGPFEESNVQLRTFTAELSHLRGKEHAYLHTISYHLKDTRVRRMNSLALTSCGNGLQIGFWQSEKALQPGNAGAGSALKWEGKEVLGGPQIAPYFISLIRLSDLKGAGLEKLGVGMGELRQLEIVCASLPSWSFTSGL